MKITVYRNEKQKLILMYKIYIWTEEDRQRVLNNLSENQFYVEE